MNLNEVKKHVYFNLAIYVGIGICLLISLIAILITPVKAQEVSVNFTNSIYPGYVNNYGCNSGSTGQYCAISTGGNVNPRSFNTRYNGVLQSIEFESNFYFRNNTTYTFDIYANSNDFRNNNVTAYCYSYDNYPSQSVSVGCSYRYISKTHIQVVYPYNSHSHHFIQIVGNQVTGDTNYSLKSVYVTYDDGTQDFGGVIDNATQNTTDIINNSNSNTQDIINAINEGTTDMCSNIFNYSSYYASFNGAIVQDINPNTIKVYSESVWGWLQYKLPTTSGETYHLKGQAVSSRALNGDTPFIQVCSDVDCANLIYVYESNGTFDTTFTATQDVYFRLFATKGVSPSTSNYYEVMISKEDKPFCPFGTRISKIDEQLKAQEEANRILNELGYKTDETNAYLKDDTNPSVNTSGIDDVMSSVEITDPLNYLLTLPISLLTKLNQVLSTNTCSRVSFGSLYNTELYLPCINFEQILGSNIWGTIDLIVGVGLLAIIFKRFYDSISNVLTLGKEKEVRDKLDLPTPMQFLASILGGGRD